MAIKIIFAVIGLFAVSFLTGFLIALLRESALMNRIKIRGRIVVKAETMDMAVPRRKLSRLRVADGNEIRLIPMS